MPEQIIEVTISPNGDSINVDLNGFHGKGCKAVADAFSKLGKIENEQIKPEFYEGGQGPHVSTGR